MAYLALALTSKLASIPPTARLFVGPSMNRY